MSSLDLTGVCLQFSRNYSCLLTFLKLAAVCWHFSNMTAVCLHCASWTWATCSKKRSTAFFFHRFYSGIHTNEAEEHLHNEQQLRQFFLSSLGIVRKRVESSWRWNRMWHHTGRDNDIFDQIQRFACWVNELLFFFFAFFLFMMNKNSSFNSVYVTTTSFFGPNLPRFLLNVFLLFWFFSCY